MTKSAAEHSEASWRARLGALVEEQEWGKWREEMRLRDLFYKLKVVISSTPPNILQDFDAFDENQLANHAHEQMRFDFTPRLHIEDGSSKQVLFLACSLLRTTEELLIESNEVAPSSGASSWLTTCKKAYILPMARGIYLGAGAKTGQSFDRRGWLKHRIIPTSVRDVDVVIIRHPDLSLKGTGDYRTIGAALFPNFELQTQKVDERRFVVRSVTSENGIDRDVLDHLENARNSNCDTVVWPELTIQPEMALIIRNLLANAPLMTAFAPIVVAGSWHVGEGESFQNLATVLSGQGRPLFRFGKSRKFMFGDLTEAIEPCGTVHIVMTDRELIGFAICKDFCDLASPVSTKELDVDLFVVPSMGGPTTMTAHRDAASEVRVRYGARTAVVQQNYPRTADAASTGYLLQAPNKPAEFDAKGLECNSPFTIFHNGG